MRPIVTLTINPTIDAFCRTDRVIPVRKVRTHSEHYVPGGGGLNASRMIRELGGATVAFYMAGGLTGQAGALRMAIARALVNRPRILIADEPTGNLDPVTSWEIIKLLTRVCELGTTLVMATHNAEIVNALRRRVVHLDHGMVVRDVREGLYAA